MKMKKRSIYYLLLAAFVLFLGGCACRKARDAAFYSDRIDSGLPDGTEFQFGADAPVPDDDVDAAPGDLTLPDPGEEVVVLPGEGIEAVETAEKEYPADAGIESPEEDVSHSESEREEPPADTVMPEADDVSRVEEIIASEESFKESEETAVDPEEPLKEEEKTEVLPEVTSRPARPFNLPFERWNGEFLIYQVNWNFVRLGTGIIVCKEEERAGRSFYHLMAMTLPEGILANRGIGYQRVDTYVDKETLEPYYFYHYKRNRNKEDILEVFYNWEDGLYRWKARKFENGRLYSTKEEVAELPPDSYDTLSALFIMRESVPGVAEALEVPLAMREMWTLTLKPPVRQTGNISGIGARDVYVFSPEAESEEDSLDEGSFRIWITADSSRIPIYMEGRVPLGRARVTLTSRTRIDPLTKLDNAEIGRILSRFN